MSHFTEQEYATIAELAKSGAVVRGRYYDRLIDQLVGLSGNKEKQSLDESPAGEPEPEAADQEHCAVIDLRHLLANLGSVTKELEETRAALRKMEYEANTQRGRAENEVEGRLAQYQQTCELIREVEELKNRLAASRGIEVSGE